MPKKKCMYEGCDAPEHRKSGYCIRHTESGPRSILINTSKLVDKKPSDEVKVEFVEEEELENEEEVQPDIEDETQEEEQGFEYEGIWITNPYLSECGRFEVDPKEYYGVDV